MNWFATPVSSQVPPAHLQHEQTSVDENRTPTYTQPPLGGQVSVVEARTPTAQQPQGEEMWVAHTQGNLQEAVITALMDRQQQENMSTLAERVKTPTEPAKSPTESVETPTEPINTPTEPVKTPTDHPKSPTDRAKTPTDRAKTPTEPVKGPNEFAKSPTEPVKTPTESNLIPTEPSIPTAEVVLPADDTAPSHHAPPPADQPRPPVGGDFLSELAVQLQKRNAGTQPAVTVLIPPPVLPVSAQVSHESEKSGAVYTALASFEGNPEEHTVSLYEGQLVHVIDCSQNEWWLVAPLTQTGEEMKEGWAPANFLQALDEPPPSDHESSLGYVAHQYLFMTGAALISTVTNARIVSGSCYDVHLCRVVSPLPQDLCSWW